MKALKRHLGYAQPRNPLEILSCRPMEKSSLIVEQLTCPMGVRYTCISLFEWSSAGIEGKL